MVRQNVSYLFSVIAGWRAYAGAEIPAGGGEIAHIDTAGPVDDVTKRERIVQVLVNLLVFFGAGWCGISGGVEDGGKGRRGNAGAAYDEPLENLSLIWVGVVDPDSVAGVLNEVVNAGDRCRSLKKRSRGMAEVPWAGHYRGICRYPASSRASGCVR